MSLDLGTLSGRIEYDISPAQASLRTMRDALDSFAGEAFDRMPDAAMQAVRETATQLDRLSPEARQAAQQARDQVDTQLRGAADEAEGRGGGVADMFGKGLKGGAAGLAVIAAGLGAGAGAALAEAMEREVTFDRLGLRIGGRPERQAEAGRIAGQIYAGAYGESIEEVADAVYATSTTVDGIRGDGLQHLTELALSFSDVVGVEVPRSLQLAEQLVTNGLAKNTERGLDLMLAASRRTKAGLVEDVLDAADEYGQYFSMIGIGGPEMFTMLADASKYGTYAIDKTGDAVGEFTKLVGGDLTKTKPIIERLGLDYTKVSNDVLAGGRRGGSAMTDVARALLEVDKPAQQARMALELFGTPFEDLSLKRVPELLDSLASTQVELGNYQGSVERADKALGDNASTNLTKFKRGLQTELVDFIGGEVIPVLRDWTDSLDDEVGPAADAIADVWDRVGPVIGGVIDWIANDVFPEAIEAYGRVAAATGEFWDDVSAEWNEHPEIAEGAAMLVDGFQWLVEHAFPAFATAAEKTLPVVADGIGGVLDIVEDFAIGWTYVGEYGAKSASVILDAFGWAFEGILDFASASLGWVFDLLGKEDPFEKASANFEAFREDATTKLDLVATGAKALREQLQEEITPNVDIGPAMAAINRLNTMMPGGEIIDGRPQPGGTVQTNPAWMAADDDRNPDASKGKNHKTASGDGDAPGGNTTHVTAYVQPHDYNEFRRQLAEDERRARAQEANGGPRQRPWMGG